MTYIARVVPPTCYGLCGWLREVSVLPITSRPWCGFLNGQPSPARGGMCNAYSIWLSCTMSRTLSMVKGRQPDEILIYALLFMGQDAVVRRHSILSTWAQGNPRRLNCKSVPAWHLSEGKECGGWKLCSKRRKQPRKDGKVTWLGGWVGGWGGQTSRPKPTCSNILPEYLP